MAVSYTHLDVYKRQVVHHGRLCEPEGLKTCDTLLQKSFRDGERLFFKPVNGQGGTGIKVFKKGRDGKLSAFISRLDHKTQYVVQAGIEPVSYTHLPGRSSA